MERWSVVVDNLGNWDGVEPEWGAFLSCKPTTESALRQALATHGWNIDSLEVFDRGFGGSKMDIDHCIHLECSGQRFDPVSFVDALAKLGIEKALYVLGDKERERGRESN